MVTGRFSVNWLPPHERLATPFAFVSTHALEQKADVLRRSSMLLRPPRLRQTRVSSQPNTLAVVGPAA
jgi:hypothetical protein